MKIDSKDKELLYYLDVNSRASLGELGKKLRLSKNSVNYRLNNLSSKEVIKQFYSVINTKKLGYSYFKIYFKLKNIESEKENLLINYLKSKMNSLWIASCDGKYDLFAGVLAKNNEEFYKMLYGFLNKFSNSIKDYNIYIVIYSPHFKRRYLLEKEIKEKIKIEKFGGSENREEIIDEKDRKILREISKNARIPLIDLVSRIKLSLNIVRHRIKKLKEKGILEGFRVLIDNPKIDYQTYKVLINTENLNEEIEKEIINYCSLEKNFVDIILRGIGLWDMEVQIDAKDSQEFHEIFRKFKEKFDKVVKDYNVLTIREEYKLNYFPF